MLTKLLKTINTTTEPFSIHQLSRKMEVEPSVLEGMLAHLVSIGRLKDEDMPSNDDVGQGCAGHCGGSGSCAYVARMPKSYSVNQPKKF
ncbi:MAG TPA: FeoC-like transcriptional regulator [Anaerolineales bacterium]|nr:FeoC-like transcriptional regulator [Anaerolineales bacterium]